MNLRLALIDCGSAKFNALARIVDSFAGSTTHVLLDAATTHDFASADAVVISGGPHLFTGETRPELRAKVAFLNRLHQPVLGICFGHQALGLSAGGEVFRGEERRASDEIRISDTSHPLVRGLGDRVILGQDHTEGVTLPAGYRVLGASRFYPNEIMANDPSRRYGVQCHPEISGEAGVRLIRNFFGIAEAEFPPS